MAQAGNINLWPELPFGKWRDSCDTLHLLTQIAGKIRLDLSPFEPQWGHAGLLVYPKGITTGPIPYGNRLFAIDFDLVDHKIHFYTNDKYEFAIRLRPMSVSEYYKHFIDGLAAIDVKVAINPKPQEVPNPILFLQDTIHSAYDQEWVDRFWTIVRLTSITLGKYRANYRGKTTPVNFWWGTFDLSVSRFSGLPAEPPANAGLILRNAMDAQMVEVGFWPGDERLAEPAFYSFTYPQPEGIASSHIEPEEARWDKNLREFILPYENVRLAEDPEKVVLDFCESTFQAGVKAAGWDLKNLV